MLLAAAGYLLIIITIFQLALRKGSDTLIREQLAELPQDSNNTVAVLWLVLVFIIMPISARMVIDNASFLARYFGLSDLIVGLTLTVLAIGTSLPNWKRLWPGPLKGEDDIALGNIIGSNIFNSVIVLGVPALLSPGPFNPDAFARDYWVMLAASIILAALYLRKRRRINRLSGLCWFVDSSPISGCCLSSFPHREQSGYALCRIIH